jgi:hypothetical protein
MIAVTHSGDKPRVRCCNTRVELMLRHSGVTVTASLVGIQMPLCSQHKSVAVMFVTLRRRVTFSEQELGLSTLPLTSAE